MHPIGWRPFLYRYLLNVIAFFVMFVCYHLLMAMISAAPALLPLMRLLRCRPFVHSYRFTMMVTFTVGELLIMPSTELLFVLVSCRCSLAFSLFLSIL